MLRKMTRAAFHFFVSAGLLGCSVRGCSQVSDIPPEDQLHSYISLAVNVTTPEQKQELLDLTTGDLKSALSGATEESFKRAYIDRKYDFKSFDILERKDVPDKKEVTIDFKLVYKSWNAGESADRAPVIETTNRATLDYENGQWALAKVESQGSNFEWEVGLPMDNVSTQGVKPEDAPKEIQSTREVPEEQNEQ